MNPAAQHAPSNPAETGASRTKQRVHALVQAAGEHGISVAEVARAAGIHPNTARFHLSTLTRTGALTAGTAHPEGRGRPSKQFFPIAPENDGETGYRLLATIFAEGLSAEPDGPARAARIGRHWGAQQVHRSDHRQASTARDQGAPEVFALMERYGFDPEWGEDSAAGTRLRLRACPFTALVKDHAKIVCALHGGLIEGALEASDSALGLDRLTPFTDPTTCTAALARNREHRAAPRP